MRSTILAFVVLSSAGLGGGGSPYIRAVKRPRPSGLDQLRSAQRSHVRRFWGGFRRRSRSPLSALLLLSAHSLRPSLCLHCSPSSGLNCTVLRLSRCLSAAKKAQPRRTAPKKKEAPAALAGAPLYFKPIQAVAICNAFPAFSIFPFIYGVLPPQ